MSTDTPTTTAAAPPLAHQPSLDGIRALAVLAVMLFHAGNTYATAGFIGVDVFLVLSGFLITLLLLRELRSSGRVAFGAFWIRRARRRGPRPPWRPARLALLRPELAVRALGHVVLHAVRVAVAAAPHVVA